MSDDDDDDDDDDASSLKYLDDIRNLCHQPKKLRDVPSRWTYGTGDFKSAQAGKHRTI